MCIVLKGDRPWEYGRGRRPAPRARSNRTGDSVIPANLDAVRKLLDERGLLPADEFDNRLYKAPA